MATYRVILVEPKSEGNVGAVARVMKNFGVEELVLVRPPRLGNEAKGRAMHAWDLVEAARHAPDFDDAIGGCDFLVGTSARIPLDERSHLRNPISARDLPSRLASMSGTVGLLLGREDFGLFNEELEACDVLVTIPTTDQYKSLNLSHAAAVLLYELYAHERAGDVKRLTPMSEEMKLTFQRAMDRLIEHLALPQHKARNAKRVYRKVFGRAVPSAWEYFVLMGILSGALRSFGVEFESGRYEPHFELPEDLEEELRSMFEQPP